MRNTAKLLDRRPWHTGRYVDSSLLHSRDVLCMSLVGRLVRGSRVVKRKTSSYCDHRKGFRALYAQALKHATCHAIALIMVV